MRFTLRNERHERRGELVVLDLDVEANQWSMTITHRGVSQGRKGRLVAKPDGKYLLLGPGNVGRIQVSKYFECDACCIDRLYGTRSWTMDLWVPPTE